MRSPAHVYHQTFIQTKGKDISRHKRESDIVIASSRGKAL